MKKVYHFYAEWCGPCKAVEGVVKALEKNYKDSIEVIHVDADINEELVEQAGVGVQPCFVFDFKDNEVARIVGANVEQLNIEFENLAKR